MGAVPAGGGEFGVTFAASAAFHYKAGLSVREYIADKVAASGVAYNRSERHGNVKVFAVFAVALFGFALAAVFGNVLMFELKVVKTYLMPVADEVDRSALSAVAAVGSAVRNAFIAYE